MLSRLIAALVNLSAREPLRLRAYALTVLVAGYLLTKGVVSADDVDFYVSLAGLVLGVESARKRVSPVRR